MRRILYRFFLTAVVLLSSVSGFAHPMPYSELILDIKQKYITAELKLPLKEMQFAVNFNVVQNPSQLIELHQADITAYLLKHIQLQSPNGKNWKVDIGEMRLSAVEQEATGLYNELIVPLKLTPPENQSPRKLTLHYDAIVHQLVTHKILVAIRQDFNLGKLNAPLSSVGYIYMDPATNRINPIDINLEEGSSSAGFKSMVLLGMQHIAEGTDHLLFLLVLLLIAPLVTSGKNWSSNGNTTYNLIRLLKIITAFTIGHSLTLLLSTEGIIKLPAQPIEICIAITILLTSLHLIKPIFPNKEIYITAAFGLIHGLAFANTLSNLELEKSRLIICLLGFNIGIELMQLFVVLLFFPWLLLLSTTSYYKWIRISGAIFAVIASLAWIAERTSQQANTISIFVQDSLSYGKFIALALALFTVIVKILDKRVRQ